jgi:hypothetical protein
MEHCVFLAALMKLALMRTPTGKEGPELPLLQRISSLELPASESSTSECSPNKCFRVQVTDFNINCSEETA